MRGGVFMVAGRLVNMFGPRRLPFFFGFCINILSSVWLVSFGSGANEL